MSCNSMFSGSFIMPLLFWFHDSEWLKGAHFERVQINKEVPTGQHCGESSSGKQTLACSGICLGPIHTISHLHSSPGWCTLSKTGRSRWWTRKLCCCSEGLSESGKWANESHEVQWRKNSKSCTWGGLTLSTSTGYGPTGWKQLCRKEPGGPGGQQVEHEPANVPLQKRSAVYWVELGRALPAD